MIEFLLNTWIDGLWMTVSMALFLGTVAVPIWVLVVLIRWLAWFGRRNRKEWWR